MRPMIGERHTLENILETGFYTINHIHREIATQSHFTSADFPRDISEFDICKFTAQYLDGFVAPYVQESRIKIGLSLAERMDIKLNGTIMIIGQIEHVYMDNQYFDPANGLDLNQAGTICVSGLDSYHEVHKFASFPYARVNNLPDF